MPFTCEPCGGRADVLRATGGLLTCDHCGATRSFVRPPLMIVTGAAGSGKSTLCQRLAGTIDDVVVLDADILAEDVVAVVSPNHDYPAFWRLLLRLAHEMAQNRVAVVYFGICLPEQVRANEDLYGYFAGVHMLGLVCDETDLRARIQGRAGGIAAASRVALHVDVNRRIAAAANDASDLTIIDGSRPGDDVERDARAWIEGRLTGFR